MREWLECGIHLVNDLLRTDQDFRELFQRLEITPKEYDAVVEKLSLNQRQVIEDYISLCEELEYQKTFTAYYCGKRNG